MLLAIFLKGMISTALALSSLNPFLSFWFSLFSALFSFLIIFVYFIWFHTFIGQTLGKMLLGIKVTDIGGKRASLLRIVFRTFGYSLSFTFFFLGFFWAAFDRKKQGWHDKLAGTVVLEA